MPRHLNTLFSALVALIALPLLLLFAPGTARALDVIAKTASLPSQHGRDMADDDDGDSGDDGDDVDSGDDDSADSGDDAADDADSGDDAADADDSADSADDAADADSGDEAEMESDESAEYSESSEEAYYGEYESYSETSETYEEWSSDVQLSSVTSSTYGYSFQVPVGGKTSSRAASAGDPLAYPFVWTNDGGMLVFDKVELGVIDNGSKINAKSFEKLGASEDKRLLAKYKREVSPEPHKLGAHKWLYSAYRAKNGSELGVFSTYEGNNYYSLFFYGPISSDEAWNQMAAIAASFD